jgi:hypothetical protein
MPKNIAINSKAAAVTKLIAGAKKRFPNGTQTVTIGGQGFTVDQLTTEMQSFVDNRAATVAAQAAAKAKVATERAQRPSLLAVIAAFVMFVRLTFGEQADALADFGLEPPKAPAPQTAEAKAVAAAKRLATREARGTTSAKAKKNIKGNVTAQLVVTPMVSSAAAANAVPPAPTAPAAGSTPANGGASPPAKS